MKEAFVFSVLQDVTSPRRVSAASRVEVWPGRIRVVVSGPALNRHEVEHSLLRGHSSSSACKRTVSGSFHSPSGVLFTFPSRYLCTIGR